MRAQGGKWLHVAQQRSLDCGGVSWQHAADMLQQAAPSQQGLLETTGWEGVQQVRPLQPACCWSWWSASVAVVVARCCSVAGGGGEAADAWLRCLSVPLFTAVHFTVAFQGRRVLVQRLGLCLLSAQQHRVLRCLHCPSEHAV